MSSVTFREVPSRIVDDHCEYCFEMPEDAPEKTWVAHRLVSSRGITDQMGHFIHETCLRTWMRIQRKCPSCSFQVDSVSLDSDAPKGPAVVIKKSATTILRRPRR